MLKARQDDDGADRAGQCSPALVGENQTQQGTPTMQMATFGHDGRRYGIIAADPDS